MLEIILLTIKIYALLLIVGYGVFESLFRNKEVKSFSLLISPWLGVCVIAIFGVWLSLLGVNMGRASGIILIVTGIYSLYTYIKLPHQPLGLLQYLTAGFMLVGLLFNLVPLLFNIGYATTISQSNLDPVSYSTVADYLTNHTVHDGVNYTPYSPHTWSVGDLVHYSYRWGSPILLSFFSSLLMLPAVKVYSILLNLLFVLGFPIIVLLAKLLNKKTSLLIVFVLGMTYLFNSTLLYMLYNVFFAQFIFSGVFMLSVVIYLLLNKQNTSRTWSITKLDIALAILVSATTTLYPEGLFLITLPIIFHTAFQIISNKSFEYIKILKVFIVATIISPYSMFTAVNQLIKVVLSSINPGKIGWIIIRQANPMELMGFFNLYYSNPLPKMLFVISTIGLLATWLMGFMQSKHRKVIFSYLSVFFLSYFLTWVIGKNFFTYHRALTYTLFIYLVYFGLFIDEFTQIIGSKVFKILIILVISAMSLRSAQRTIIQLYSHPEVVDKSLYSLQELNNVKVSQPFYTADVFTGEYHLWRRLWQEYFLSGKKIVSIQNLARDKELIDRQLPVLTEKRLLERFQNEISYQSIEWENEYYVLGMLKPELYKGIGDD